MAASSRRQVFRCDGGSGKALGQVNTRLTAETFEHLETSASVSLPVLEPATVSPVRERAGDLRTDHTQHLELRMALGS